MLGVDNECDFYSRTTGGARMPATHQAGPDDRAARTCHGYGSGRDAAGRAPMCVACKGASVSAESGTRQPIEAEW